MFQEHGDWCSGWTAVSRAAGFGALSAILATGVQAKAAKY
jgi:hypothetical protein